LADSLTSLRQRVSPNRAAPDAASPPADPDEGEYLGACAARVKAKVEPALTVKLPGRDWVSFQYSGLATFSDYTPHSKFVLTFHDDRESRRVVVVGRNLELIYLRVIAHRVEWLKPADRGEFEAEADPVILAVTVTPVGPDRTRPTPSVSTRTNKELTTAPA
jgi:hypothetical protein